MKINSRNSNKKTKKKQINLSAVVAVSSLILIGCLGYLVYSSSIDKSYEKDTTSSIKPPIIPTGQDGSSQVPVDIEDTEGADKNSGSSDGVASESGDVTLNSPEVNGFLGDGASIYGTAKVSLVSYRIIDNTRGVIAEGKLAVKNNQFSAKINDLANYSNSGVLQVFSLDSQGREINLVQINVSLEQ